MRMTCRDGWLALMLCTVVGVGFGCAGSDSDGDGGGGGDCDLGETFCRPLCVNLETNAENCGACQNACTGDTPDCVGGVCSPGGGDSDTDTDSDSDTETPTPTDPPVCDDNCIDVADPEIPDCSDIGIPCRDNRDCELGFFCVPDANGWPEGYCLAGGPENAGGCDPDLPASCPDGSTCQYGGVDDEGRTHYYCFKDCAITDRNPWDTSSCGCRDGYECDLLDEVCGPGCTTVNKQDDCCQYWADTNGDFINDGAAEFEDIPGCTVMCNEDAYRCANPGDPDAAWGDACTFNQDCPVEGVCLRERDRDGDPDTPEHFFADGYCTRFGCDLDGRECETRDDCRNLGSDADPAWLCTKTCEVAPEGADMWTHRPCGDDYGCYADSTDPDAAMNGFCWTPGRYNDVRTQNIGEACLADADCYSPFGQGLCLEEQGGSGWLGGTCIMLACDFPGMEGLCNEADDNLCEQIGGLGWCIDRCTDPGGGFGVAAGCRDDNYACYAADAGGGAAGICFPACNAQPDPDDFCGSFFNGAPNCNDATGICEA